MARRRQRSADKLRAPDVAYGEGERRARPARRDDAEDAARPYLGDRRACREDAWQRQVEFLFERLAVSWTIAGAEPLTRQSELLGALPLRHRRRSAPGSASSLRAHLAEHFPELPAP